MHDRVPASVCQLTSACQAPSSALRPMTSPSNHQPSHTTLSHGQKLTLKHQPSSSEEMMSFSNTRLRDDDRPGTSHWLWPIYRQLKCQTQTGKNVSNTLSVWSGSGLVVLESWYCSQVRDDDKIEEKMLCCLTVLWMTSLCTFVEKSLTCSQP